MVVTQGFFMLFGSGIVVWAGVEASMLVRSEAGLIGTRRCVDAGFLPVCVSAGLE